MAAAPLVGRGGELALFDATFDRVASAGQKLLVRGEPGIGKSALLDEVATRAGARGFTVIRLTGYQSEARLPLAGLQQLLQPLASRVRGLPEAQRSVIESAFGSTPEDAASFLISLATLNLLSEAAAADGPVLVVAEDAQWLDPPTCEALAFVARRLESDRLFLVLTARTGHTGRYDHEDLPELELAGLDDEAAAELLRFHGRDLSDGARRRILRASEGNPLALVELSASAASAGAAGPDLATSLPLTARLEQVFSDRAATLDGTTRELLLVAALNSPCARGEALAAASIVVGAPVPVTALDPAIAAGLITIDGDRVRFRHPLVRSAIAQSASRARRHAVHAALAQVLADEPDRSLWHRAASTIAPDGELAQDLEDAATRSRRFRDVSVAVAGFRRAAELSPTTQDRAARLLLGAESAFEMGRGDVGEQLMSEVEHLDLSASLRARVAWSREAFGTGVWTGAPGLRSSIRTIDEMRANGDTELALRSLYAVATRAWWGNPDREIRRMISAAADRLDVAPEDPMMLVLTAMGDPDAHAEVVCARARRRAPDVSGDPDLMRTLGVALSYVGALDECARYYAAADAGLRAQGRLRLVAETLTGLALTELLRGNFAASAAAADECDRLAEETGQLGVSATARAITAALAAIRGDGPRALAIAAEVEQVFTPLGANPQLGMVEMARGMVALSEDRPADAFDHMRRMFDPADPAHHPYLLKGGIIDLVEAGVACGRTPEVRDLLAPLLENADATTSQILHVQLAFARPLIAPDDEAEALYLAALDSEHARWPYVRARIQLAHGSWLRRSRRLSASRAPLRSARDTFDALGATFWADRARRTLRATGEQTSRPKSEGLDELTSQELQVIELAAEGLTNREIGERLYLSHRTVGVHLYRAFPKLGITSRAQIRGVLDRAQPAPSTGASS